MYVKHVKVMIIVTLSLLMQHVLMKFAVYAKMTNNARSLVKNIIALQLLAALNVVLIKSAMTQHRSVLMDFVQLAYQMKNVEELSSLWDLIVLMMNVLDAKMAQTAINLKSFLIVDKMDNVMNA